MLIFCTEDDPTAANILARELEREGHEVILFSNTVDTLEYARSREPDVLIADFRLARSSNGLVLAEQMRKLYRHCVIIMISSYAEILDTIRAIQINVDDFVLKRHEPITGPQFIERIHAAVIRRQSWLPRAQTVSLFPIELDADKHTVTLHGQSLELTPFEYELLQTLVSRPGHVFTYSDLYAAMRKQRVEREEARILLKHHIGSIRRKLASISGWENAVQSIRGIGYKWQANGEYKP